MVTQPFYPFPAGQVISRSFNRPVSRCRGPGGGGVEGGGTWPSAPSCSGTAYSRDQDPAVTHPPTPTSDPPLIIHTTSTNKIIGVSQDLKDVLKISVNARISEPEYKGAFIFNEILLKLLLNELICS